MRDGVTLPVSVHYPVPKQEGETFPAIIYVHAWDMDKSMGEWFAKDYAPKGYICVSPTMRGWFGAGGEVGCMDPDKDVRDLSDIITLLSEDKRFPLLKDAKGPVVGVTGYSMGGCFSYLIAPRENPRPGDPGDPRVRAVVPMHGYFDLLFSLYPNGAFKLFMSSMLLSTAYAGNFSGCLMQVLTTVLNDQMGCWDKICRICGYVRDLVSFPSNEVDGSLADTFTLAVQRRVGEIDKAHAFAKTRSARYWCDEEYDGVVEHPIVAPILIMAGWQDDLFYANEAMMAYQSTKAPKRLIIDNHGHIGGMPGPFPIDFPTKPSYQWTSKQVEDWFDHYLKGVDNGVEKEPRVTFYRHHDPENFGVAEDYPLPGSSSMSFYLSNNGNGERKLYRNTPDIKTSRTDMLLNLGFTGSISTMYFQDVTELFGMDALDIPIKFDLLEIPCTEKNFVSDPLTEDVTIMGAPKLELFYRCSKEFAQIIPWLYEVGPDGKETLVCRGYYEGYNPKIWSMSSTADHPIEMQAIYHRFPAGSRIKLELTTADLPSTLPYLDFSLISLYSGGKRASRLILPIVENSSP